MQVEYTAHEWELYVSNRLLRQKCAAAATALNQALNKGLEAVDAGMHPHDAMDKFVYPVMDQHADTGAADTEPREVAVNALYSVWQAYTASKA